MKSILYILNQRIPTEKAYGIQVVKMCEAFADLGFKVELATPWRQNPIEGDIFTYFNVRNNFKHRVLPGIDFYLPGKFDSVAVNVKSFLSALELFFQTVFSKFDFIYSRDELPLYLLSFFKHDLCFEAHKFSQKKSFFYRRFKKAGVKLITISEGLKKEFEAFGFDSILVAHDGVDLNEFNISKSKEDCRSSLQLPQDKKIIGYVGQLRTMGMEKGIESLIEAYIHLRQSSSNLTMVVVGGSGKDLQAYKNIIKQKVLSEDDILFTGQKEHSMIPMFLKSFDVLTMPFPDTKHYASYMSPLKLFEYMASGRPIIASNLPTVAEVLNSTNAVLVKPGDSEALAQGISEILTNPELAERLSRQALQDAQEYSWKKRAQHIIRFISGAVQIA